MTLVDSNTLIDIWSKDPVWHDWSEAALRDCLLKGEIAINPIILAELSLGFNTQAECETVILDYTKSVTKRLKLQKTYHLV